MQIWDADIQTVITTLPFANSSVLDLAWRPNGASIAISGKVGVKVWSTQDWDDDPYLIVRLARLLQILSLCYQVSSWFSWS